VRATDKRAALLPAGGETGVGFEFGVERGGVADQLRHAFLGAQLADEARRVPGGAAGQLTLFEQYDIGPTQFRQMVGH
jgi:hypothetical protein